MTRTIAFAISLAALVGSVWTVSGQQAPSAAAQQEGGLPAGPQSRVTKQQFDEWMTKLSNWGRWGKDDERGALNLITAEKSRQATALGKTGTTLLLSRANARTKPTKTPQPRPVNHGGALVKLFPSKRELLFW